MSASSRTPPSILLFDLGGVLIDIDFRRVTAHWAQSSGRSADDLYNRLRPFFDHEMHFKHERGEISDADFFQAVRDVLDLDINDEAMLAGWNAIFKGPMRGVKDLLIDLDGTIPLYGFSNTNNAHEIFWRDAFADVIAPVRSIFTSNRIGKRKPESEAFHHIASEMGGDPSEILFFDDTLPNVVAARGAGLHAEHSTETAHITDALKTYGIF